MGNYYPPFSLRISESLLSKIKFMAIRHKRSTNKELEYAVENYVLEYEKINGEIDPEKCFIETDEK